MNVKTRIFVVLAFVIAAFYSLEVTLTVVHQGLVGPAFVKAGIVGVALFYAITAIMKGQAANKTSAAEKEKA